MTQRKLSPISAGKSSSDLRPLERSHDSGRALEEAARVRLDEITMHLIKETNRTVMSGPFSGMRLPDETSWGAGQIVPKLLGSYEEELHNAIERAISRQPTIVVNVGCAEGYYTVGLARRLPQARIYAFDINKRAQVICRDAAAANGVGERVTVAGRCTPEILQGLAGFSERGLIVMDCEGGELTLLDGPTIMRLDHVDLIVETHEFIDRAITLTLQRLLGANHVVELICEGARDPGKFTLLNGLSSLDRWLAVCEFRPEAMSWLASWALQSAPHQ